MKRLNRKDKKIVSISKVCKAKRGKWTRVHEKDERLKDIHVLRFN